MSVSSNFGSRVSGAGAELESGRSDRDNRQQDLSGGAGRRNDQDASMSTSIFTTTAIKATSRSPMSRGLDEATASSMLDLSSGKDKSQRQQEKEEEEKEKERDAKEIDKDRERRDKEREREERRERRKEKERRREERKQKKELSKTSMSKSDDVKRSMDGPIVSEDLLRAAGVAMNEIGDIPDADVDVPQFKRTTETESRPRLEEATENKENEQGFKSGNAFEQLMLRPHPLITDFLSREKRRINQKGAFTLADFVSDAELFQLLLQYLTFYDWSLLASVSRVIRIVMVQKKDVREEILERYLSGTIGYQRWSWDEPEPLSLSIQVSFSQG